MLRCLRHWARSVRALSVLIALVLVATPATSASSCGLGEFGRAETAAAVNGIDEPGETGEKTRPKSLCKHCCCHHAQATPADSHVDQTSPAKDESPGDWAPDAPLLSLILDGLKRPPRT